MRRKSLAEEYPELVPQWGTINDLSPDKVSSGSHKKVWWVCKEGHTWEATIKNRTLSGSGCPYCEHRAVLKGYNDLQTVFPEVAKTWSPKNESCPSEVSPSSNKAVLWVCENGHEWKARVADRTEGHGCPYCAGQRVWKGFNDLATTHPQLATEWSDRNKSLSPNTITYKNRSNVWWHCNKCSNDYQAVVYARANGRVCPFCIAKELKRIREIRMSYRQIARDCAYLLPQLAVIYYAGQYGIKVITDSEDPIGIPVTARLPELNLIIDVTNHPKEKRVKELICGVNGIKYVNLPENLPETEIISMIRKAFAESRIYLNSDPVEDLERIKASYTRWRKA